jgi:hypothetical protein
MTVSLNWQPILGAVLLIAGAIVGGVQWWRSRSASPQPSQALTRSADAPAPPGAVQWVADIRSAMGAAMAESVLAALADGATRDQARMLRIAELEKPAEPAA